MSLDTIAPEAPNTRTERRRAPSTPSLIDNLRTSTEALERSVERIIRTLGRHESDALDTETDLLDTPNESTAFLDYGEILDTIDTADGLQLDQLEKSIIAETRATLRTLHETRATLLETESNTTRLTKAITSLREHPINRSEQLFYPRVGFSADGGAIEGQWVEVLDIESQDKKTSHLQINFKLTETHIQTLLEKLARNELPSNTSMEHGSIDIHPYKQTVTDPTPLSEAYVLQRGGVTIRVSKGKTVRIFPDGPTEMEERCAIGLITAEIEKTDPQHPVKKLAELMEELGVKNCFGEPTKEDEASYKKARYAWHHKIHLDKRDGSDQDIDAGIERLTKKEIMPGYSTYLEVGKHREYESIAGAISIYHDISLPPEDFSKLFSTYGLLCTRKRLEGGQIDYEGLSSRYDLMSGGGDSVFTRIVTEHGLISQPNKNGAVSMPRILFKPTLLDRTDWYAFESDECGETTKEKLDARPSPKELFEKQARGDFRYNNEQMFRYGIGVEEMSGIMINGNEGSRIDNLLLLAEKGLSEIGGKTFKDLVFMTRSELVEHYKKHKESLNMTDLAIEKTLEEDSRDKIIASFEAAGISEINGQPIRAFVRYGEKLSDQVDAVTEPNWHETPYIKKWHALFLETAKMAHDYLNPPTDDLYA